MAVHDDIMVIQDEGFPEAVFIGDELSLCGMCGLESRGTSPEGSGANTPFPATVLLPGAPGRGCLPIVPAASDLEGLSDISSGASTPSQFEVMQRLMETNLKLKSDFQSELPQCSQMPSESQSARPLGLNAGVFSQKNSHMKLSDFPPLFAASVATKFTANSAMDAIPMPSVGSENHPHSHAAPCKHTKRRNGCRMGANFDLCHFCFWQGQSATQASQAQPQKLKVDPPALSPKTEDHNCNSEIVLASLGSLKHPFGCAPACKHVRRKGGCREGAKCPNCHQCRWRRHPVENPSAGLLPKTLPGYRSDAVDVLEKLIQTYLEKTAHKVVVADLTSLTVEEPIKVPLAENSWTTKIGPFQNPNSTQAEVAVEVKPANLTQNKLLDDIPSIGSVGHPFTCKAPCKYHGKRSGCKDGADCARCHICHWSRQAAKATSSSAKVVSF